jgi:hypothetical protein
MRLLQIIQTGDVAALDVEFSESALSTADALAASDPRCSRVGIALASAVSKMAASGGALRVPAYFDGVQLTDSGTTTTVEFTVKAISPRTDATTGVVKLAYDAAPGRWIRSDGLLTMLCKVATWTAP